VKYKFIFDNKIEFSIKRMCSVFTLNPYAYHAWCRRGLSERELYDEKIKEKIIQLYSDPRLRTYGSPRLCPELNEAGLKCGHNRVAKIMRINGITARRRKKHKYKKQTNEVNYIFPNLLNRNFNQKMPNIVWVSDITFIPTVSGWVYLCVFIDLFSKRIVGWAVSSSPNTELVLKALECAIKNRRPPKGLLVHSDRGCQYTAKSYSETLVKYGFVQSMSRRGNCWDNACSESFFGHFKCDAVFEENFFSKEEVERIVFDYIECFYNRKRRHVSCGQLSPINFENMWLNILLTKKG